MTVMSADYAIRSSENPSSHSFIHSLYWLRWKDSRIFWKFCLMSFRIELTFWQIFIILVHKMTSVVQTLIHTNKAIQIIPLDCLQSHLLGICNWIQEWINGSIWKMVKHITHHKNSLLDSVYMNWFRLFSIESLSLSTFVSFPSIP